MSQFFYSKNRYLVFSLETHKKSWKPVKCLFLFYYIFMACQSNNDTFLYLFVLMLSEADIGFCHGGGWCLAGGRGCWFKDPQHRPATSQIAALLVFPTSILLRLPIMLSKCQYSQSLFHQNTFDCWRTSTNSVEESNLYLITMST